MTAETLRTIVDGLNAEPFKQNVNLISFDAISPHRLLQILSDVLQYIDGGPPIDIREETPDETALRIFNALRILRYKPPTDIEQLQEWRSGIVEGQKVAIYPILEWIFKDPEPLKERAYLAKFFEKVDIPGELQDSELADMSNEIATLMEEFKEVHSNVVEVRKDSALSDDIRTDLKTMEQEKEQLNRRIEKMERKLRGVANLEPMLHIAGQYRSEQDRLDRIALQKVEQRNAVVHCEQKLQRLNVMLKEATAANENIDPTERIGQLKEQIETNRYMVEEKLPKEIAAKRAIIAELSKVVDMPAIDNNDIAKLQLQIESVNNEIVDLVSERDKKDESSDKLSIYRHQASAASRKKAALAEKLLDARAELEAIENTVESKKKELREKSGDDVITSVQFKNYVTKLRAKTNSYKRQRADIDELKGECAILARSSDLLVDQYTKLKQLIEERGGSVVEIESAKQQERPKTAKPNSENRNELREMLTELKEAVDLRKAELAELSDATASVNLQLKEITDEFNAKKRNYETTQAAMESSFTRLQEEVKSMEEKGSQSRRKAFREEIELKIANAMIERLEAEQSGTEKPLHDLIEEEIVQANAQAEALQRSTSAAPNGDAVENAAEQVRMWRSLLRIFQLKISVAQSRSRNDDRRGLSETPIGDRSSRAPRPMSAIRRALNN